MASPYVAPSNGLLCYNNSDLIRDGYIYKSLEREINLGGASNSRIILWERRLKKKPPLGTTYKAIRDSNGKLIAILEKKQLLPADSIKLWIKFSKVMKSVLQHQVDPGSIPLPSFNLVGLGIGTGNAGGGITSGITNLTYHLCDAETKINKKYKITEEIKKSGIIEMDGYPLSIFGLIREWGDASLGDNEGHGGLEFTKDQLDEIGKFSSGSYEGGPRVKIDGATDSYGRFGETGDAAVKLDDVIKLNQEDIFIEIIKDKRRYKFRADNIEASGNFGYPFSVKDGYHDITSTSIKIDSSNLSVGETVYLTFSVASERRNRQCVRHDGRVGQGNTIAGLLGWTVEVNSILDIFDYKICDWWVPKEVPSETDSDSKWKLDLKDYVETLAFPDSGKYDFINGWRLSSVNSIRVQQFWAADYRGILLVTVKGSHFKSEVIYPASHIRDHQWFISYLESLDFTYPTGPPGANGEPTYLYTDLEKKLEDKIRKDRLAALLFDVSEFVNTLLFDREKIPYYQPFALALSSMEKSNDSDLDSGVGIPHLDLKDLSNPGGIWFDLSFAVFDPPYARPILRYSCNEPYEDRLYYNCHIYDTYENQAAFYPNEYIENTVLGWRAPGGTVQSFWQLETPYFCGNFNTKSRVYIEQMGGNSLNNYSSISVETAPFVSSTISMDKNYYTHESFLVFHDNVTNLSMSNYKISDGGYESILRYVEDDTNKVHSEFDFGDTPEAMLTSYDNSKYIGYTKVFGEFPTYNFGSSVTNALSNVCRYNYTDFFVHVDLMDTSLTYGLDFSEDIPKINLPDGHYIKDITIDYTVKSDASEIVANDNSTVLYFESSQSVISNIVFDNLYKDKMGSLVVDCKYYFGTPIHFISNMWKHLNITGATATIVDSRINDYKINSNQMSVVEQSGQLVIFYADENSGNISVVVSSDDGGNWFKCSDILRLIDGENATLPFTIKDDRLDCVHLFYVLNSSFLMYKQVDIKLFVEQDAFIQYLPRDFYDVDSDDSDLEEYSYIGKEIRKGTSYFIDGNSDDEFFIEQQEIANVITDYNVSLELDDIQDRKSIRFSFGGDPSHMKEFMGNAYSITIDGEGNQRLFVVNDGKLSIKIGRDFIRWYYLIDNFNFHKDFFDDSLNEGRLEEIKNIQIVKDEINEDSISVLYFSNGMLFVRHLQAPMLILQEIDGEVDDTQIYDHLTITRGNLTNPIFLIGEIPEDIRTMRITEMQNDVSFNDSAIAFKIPYDEEMVSKFDDRFSVDDYTQALGQTYRDGSVRVFYKDSFGNLNGLTMKGVLNITPEVLYKLKERFI
jgi:hypothetical protein